MPSNSEVGYWVHPKMRIPKVPLTVKIFIGLFRGILIGWLVLAWGLAARPLANLFLNLIKSTTGSTATGWSVLHEN